MDEQITYDGDESISSFLTQIVQELHEIIEELAGINESLTRL